MSRWESEDPYYDLIDDFDLIISSFQAQYGIRLTREIKEMPWSEFAMLLSGLDHKTPLGRIIGIRAEDDREVLKHFSTAQHKIRNEYRKKKAKKVPEAEYMAYLEGLKQMFISMAT